MWASWVIICVCTCTSYITLTVRNSFVHCKLVLYTYGDFPLKIKSIHFNARTKWSPTLARRVKSTSGEEDEVTMVTGGKKWMSTIHMCACVTEKSYLWLYWIHDLSWPHLKLLSELQVDVVHLGDGNVVIFSLLLVQQLVPERGKDEMEKSESTFYLIFFHHPWISSSVFPRSNKTLHLCTTSIISRWFSPFECLQVSSSAVPTRLYFLSNVHILWPLV